MHIGQRDQLVEALNDMAFVVKQHYDKLIQAGFEPYQAMQLTISFQHDIINPK